MYSMEDRLVGSVALRCDCLCSTFVVDKIKYSDEDGVYYNLSYQDAVSNWGCYTLKERLRAAWHMLTRKPYVHAEMFLEGDAKFAKFVGELVEMVGTRQISVADGRCHMCWDCPDGCPIENPFDSKNTPGRFDNEAR